MRVKIEALRGVFTKLIAVMENAILVDETMADAAALVAQDFARVDQPRIAEYLREIGRQNRIKAMESRGNLAALKLEYKFLFSDPI